MVYKILANTLFMGKNLVYVPECHSTNLLAANLIYRQTAHDGTLVITDHQTQGRGQRGNAWVADPGLNFTFSLILKPTFLNASQQFFLNMGVSLGLAKYLSRYVGGQSAIKWPNDILINGRKVCGILIENQLQREQIATSIVGIGLNMNQKSFAYSHATSLHQVTGSFYDLEKELEPLISAIESFYLLLKQYKFQELQRLYLDQLFGRAETQPFKVKGQLCKGRIQGVDQTGHLLVEIEGIVKKFGLKEIEHIL